MKIDVAGFFKGSSWESCEDHTGISIMHFILEEG
jgi:hypothetical protein